METKKDNVKNLNKARKIGFSILFLLLCSFVGWNIYEIGMIEKYGKQLQITIGYNVYAEITFIQYGKVKYHFSGLDPVTNLGLNLTFAKLTGYFTSAYNQSTYMQNCTYVSIGYGTPTSSSTYLPVEWAKVSGTLHALVYNGFNITGTITPPASSNSANCMGINYEGTANSTSLYGYTTFSTVTGIDNTFTIVCEIQVQGTTS
jgi:hypothetical protein